MQSSKGKWDAPKILSFEPANDGTGDRILVLSFCVPTAPQVDAPGKTEIFYHSKTVLGRTSDGRKVMLTLDLTAPTKSVVRRSDASLVSKPLVVKPPTLNERTERARALLERVGCTLLPIGEQAQHSSLIECVEAQDVESAFVLLASGYNPNERDESTATAIARAVITGNAVMVKLLSLFGADASLTNAYGVSAWDVVRRSQYSHLRDHLVGSDGVAKSQDVARQKHPYLQELEALSDTHVSASRLADRGVHRQSIEEAQWTQELRDPMDGSRYWGFSFRDNGAFGSFPGFDDYGDESSA